MTELKWSPLLIYICWQDINNIMSPALANMFGFKALINIVLPVIETSLAVCQHQCMNRKRWKKNSIPDER